MFDAFRLLSRCDRERFYSIHLDTAHRVCGVELVSQGNVDSALVSPRELYKGAILASASAVILVHKHPTGVSTQSLDDQAITRGLIEAGRLLDIPIYDHVIMGNSRYTSFAEAGLL